MNRNVMGYLRLTKTVDKRPKLIHMVVLTTVMGIAGCQTLTAPKLQTGIVKPNDIQFQINGKIGLRYTDPQTQQLKNGSAFYAWSQQGDNFAIEMSGALGIGKTQIIGNKTSASLTNSDVGTVSADSPEVLLAQTTGWQAPISQLPNWIVGKATKPAKHTVFDDQQRVIRSVSRSNQADWHVQMYYKDSEMLKPTYPYKLKIHQLPLQTEFNEKIELTDSQKKTAQRVLMTINH